MSGSRSVSESRLWSFKPPALGGWPNSVAARANSAGQTTALLVNSFRFSGLAANTRHEFKKDQTAFIHCRHDLARIADRHGGARHSPRGRHAGVKQPSRAP